MEGGIDISSKEKRKKKFETGETLAPGLISNSIKKDSDLYLSHL